MGGVGGGGATLRSSSYKAPRKGNFFKKACDSMAIATIEVALISSTCVCVCVCFVGIGLGLAGDCLKWSSAANCG